MPWLGSSRSTRSMACVRLGAPDPESVAPAAVRALVGAGGDVVEVSIEQTSLEQIYFDVMGVRPGADGIEAPD